MRRLSGRQAGMYKAGGITRTATVDGRGAVVFHLDQGRQSESGRPRSVAVPHVLVNVDCRYGN